MAMGRRTARGGPMGIGGTRLPDGARVVTPARSKAMAQQMRAALAPGKPSRMRLAPERLNLEFFREAAAELRKVHWPTREQARNFTALVIALSALVGIILGGMDFVFEKLFELIVQRAA
jgi:preprotein translocase subunit SecE